MLGARAFPTPKAVVFQDGRGTLYRFEKRGEKDGARRHERSHVPVLFVPSLVDRGNVLDLREGASLAAALTEDAPWDTYLFDWGAAEDEDRYVSWDDVLARLERVVRRVVKDSGQSEVALVGHCMGATLSAIFAALYPSKVRAFVNLAGPIDFAHAGRLGRMVDPRWFDPVKMTAAGNLSAAQMQSGLWALAPTSPVTRWVTLASHAFDEEALAAFSARETWSEENVAFPGGAYVTYIEELYQENRLIRGAHWARGRRVDLRRVRCPLLTVVADRDAICPPKAALALGDVASSPVKDVFRVAGDHVSAVAGSRARQDLYPAIRGWLFAHGQRPAMPRSRFPESRL